MYDEASYYYSSYNAPSSASAQADERPQQPRKKSLLERSSANTEAQNDGRLVQSTLAAIEEPKTWGPPQATVKRRAQSYTDFHYAARAVLRQANAPKRQFPSHRRSFGNGERDEARKVLRDDMDFEKWYPQFEPALLESTHDSYNGYYQQLLATEIHLDSVMDETTATLSLLETLAGEFRDVDSQTTAFQKQCEDLLQDQKRMEKLADELKDNLRYYFYLEPASRRLNAPSAGNMVKSKEFSDLLTRIDECLDYMAARPTHKEAPAYQARYRLLMTRGLTLVRTNFVGGLREIAYDVSRRIADKQLNDTTMSALLYAKFRVGAAENKEIAQEIRKRAVKSSGSEAGQEGEYQSLMNELYTSYAATRGKLVIPLARKQMAEIAMTPSATKDLVSFARSAIGYTRGVCADEYELWREWFVDEEGLYGFLEHVCEPLYDHLRPRIIHETKLLKLCELCTMLQNQYMHDPDEETDGPAPNQLDFSILAQPALEDAQTRLAFRAQSILRDEIERYKPKKEDIDYPARNRRVSLAGAKSKGPVLSGRKNSSTAAEPNSQPAVTAPRAPAIPEEDEGSVEGKAWAIHAEAALEGWYPTLRKAIWLLSSIYRLVHSAVFDDLAHTIVHTTTHSLINASVSISGQAHRTPSDGRLFLIKHLLFLKSQIVAFDIEYVTPDVSFDFSNLTNTFTELQRERGGLFDPRNWIRLVRGGLLPQVVENMLDAKAELDAHLRSAISEFTSSFANAITTPINQAAVASPRFDALSAVAKVKEIAAAQELPTFRKKVDEYIDDFQTRETLVAAVQELVVQKYERFYDDFTTKAQQQDDSKTGSGATAAAARKKSSAGTAARSKKGKGRDDEVLDLDMFTEWAGETFNVKGIDGFGVAPSVSRRTSTYYASSQNRRSYFDGASVGGGGSKAMSTTTRSRDGRASVRSLSMIESPPS